MVAVVVVVVVVGVGGVAGERKDTPPARFAEGRALAGRTAAAV